MKFNFTGKFTTEVSIKATAYWSSVFDKDPNQQYEFIWDCTQMEGFEINARKEWYKNMQKYKHRIAKVLVICDQIMIRSAARVMLKLFGIPSEMKKSHEYIG